ncbi:MAG TPA: TetR/AcrR family transcriptional regulator [Rhodocyclaceae bacterium]|nr:TetR/AcrR family transcriptional regulator [Rhodocyclaceae bacterium]
MNARPSFRAQVLQAREDAIVDTVNRLLADKGFDAMTVDLVAAEVGIAKGSLYLHFKTKEDLFRELAESVHRQMGEAFCQVLGATAPGRDRVRGLIRAQLAFFETHRGLFLQVFQGNLPCLWRGPHRPMELVKALINEMAKAIDEGARLGHFRRGRADEAAIGLFGLIRGFVFVHIAGDMAGSLLSRTEAVWDLFSRGVCP